MFKSFFINRDKKREDKFFANLDLIEREVSGRFSRGNFSMQVGSILTIQELERERDELRNNHKSS